MHRSPTLATRLAGPGLLLAAGVLRWLDGRDGDLGSEPWSTATHVAFLGAVVAFVALVAGVRRVASRSGAVTVALVAASLGAVGTALDIPGGLALFVLGVVGALAALAAARQVSWLEPVLALAGFAAIVVDLDLLPLGAALLAGAVAKSPATRSVRQPE